MLPSTTFNNPELLMYDLFATERFLFEVPSASSALASWLVFSFFLFFAGLLGIIFNYKNFLVTMMSIELMYLGAVTSFVLAGTVVNDPRASIYALILLIMAACESAIGLGILITLYRFGRSIDFSTYEELGG